MTYATMKRWEEKKESKEKVFDEYLYIACDDCGASLGCTLGGHEYTFGEIGSAKEFKRICNEFLENIIVEETLVYKVGSLKKFYSDEEYSKWLDSLLPEKQEMAVYMTTVETERKARLRG